MAKILDMIIGMEEENQYKKDLEILSNPENFDSVSDASVFYDEFLGYDPTFYFDRKSIDNAFDKMYADGDEDLKSSMGNNKQNILDTAETIFLDEKEGLYESCVMEAVTQETGYEFIFDDQDEDEEDDDDDESEMDSDEVDDEEDE